MGGKLHVKNSDRDDNAIQLDIIQEELKKNIKEDISYTIDTFNSEAAFTQILQSGSCPYDIVFMVSFWAMLPCLELTLYIKSIF